FYNGISLIHEPYVRPFYRCNMWHVQGRERDVLVDSGSGLVSLREQLPWLTARPLLAVAIGLVVSQGVMVLMLQGAGTAGLGFIVPLGVAYLLA
ncbi:hypothetical protein, partial [Vibrio vulnificus]|uniref:hypothetical protein n=1 Tax=Vibrio vulnificus TaxID=672 RepID=UPI0019D43D1C